MAPDRSSRSRSRSVGNEERLVALGDAIDRRSGVARKTKPSVSARRSGPKKRRSRNQRLIRIALVMAVIGVGFVGGVGVVVGVSWWWWWWWQRAYHVG